MPGRETEMDNRTGETIYPMSFLIKPSHLMFYHLDKGGNQQMLVNYNSHQPSLTMFYETCD